MNKKYKTIYKSKMENLNNECSEKMNLQKTPSYYCEDLQQSNDALNYMMFDGKYSNQDNCRVDLGIVGGNNVSQYCGNLVDLETNIRISSDSINKMFLDQSSNPKNVIN